MIHKARWLCRCDCGKDFVVIGSSLMSGNTKSCGCIKPQACSDNGKKNRLSDGGVRNLYSYYKNASKVRGIKFLLTFEEFEALTSGDCHYCGQPPSKVVFSRRAKVPYRYNGIDRKDSDLEYEISNCVSSCSICNYNKRTMHYDEFMAWLTRVFNHLKMGKV